MNFYEHSIAAACQRLFRRLALLAILILTEFPAPAQSYSVDAVSREVSVFNFGSPGAGIEAISREVSVFNKGIYSVDAVSREVSLFNYGFNHLNVAVGSTVVVAGTSGGVPVTVTTLAPVTNVQVAVDFPENLLTNWSVSAQPPLTGTAVVSNNNRLYATFSPPGGQTISNTQLLGQITFVSASNQISAFLPLPVAGVAAPMLDGTTFTPYATTQDGEVVVLHIRSLLRQLHGANGMEQLELYGFSDTNYTIEFATNMNPPANWQPAFQLTPTNLVAITPALSFTNTATFYRAKQ